MSGMKIGELFAELDAGVDKATDEISKLRGLLHEAIEGLEHIPTERGSWLDRVRNALNK